MSDYPHKASIHNLPVIKQFGDISLFPGGFGSSLSVDPKSEMHFYLLTDRGPMFKKDENKVCVLMPEFTPQIGKFRLEGEELILEKLIPLRDTQGKKLSGIPHPPQEGSTYEALTDLQGNPIAYDPKGIDPEGLVAMPDGSFWVAEEYEPALMHFNEEGKMIFKVSPYTEGHRLPQVLKHRHKNRGFEGITATPDGKKIVAIMQSALDNPDKEGKSHVCRIVTYEPANGKTEQFVYMLEDTDLSCSEIAAVTDTIFMVIERDGKPADEAKFKRIYRINLQDATDISDPEDKAHGKLFDSKTPEQLKAWQINAEKIQPVNKELVLDLLEINYPYEKPEGLIVLSPTLIAVSQDDDFCINEDEEGNLRQIVDKDGLPVHSEIQFYEIEDITESWLLKRKKGQ